MDERRGEIGWREELRRRTEAINAKVKLVQACMSPRREKLALLQQQMDRMWERIEEREDELLYGAPSNRPRCERTVILLWARFRQLEIDEAALLRTGMLWTEPDEFPDESFAEIIIAESQSEIDTVIECGDDPTD